MKNKTLKVFIVIFVLGSVLLLANVVEAKPVPQARGGGQCSGACQAQSEEGCGCLHLDKAVAEQIRAAVEAKDYDTWLSLMTANADNPGHAALLQRINSKEEFEKFVTEMAGRHEINKEKRDLKLKIHQALEAGDYAAWQAAVEARDALMPNNNFSWNDKIQSEEDFQKMREIRQMNSELKGKRQELGLCGCVKKGR
ncbi:MAG TPA: nuclear transport factor 2 family protein [bacterium]|nr:nuclear transport factor 2 family protein [bacterium]